MSEGKQYPRAGTSASLVRSAVSAVASACGDVSRTPFRTGPPASQVAVLASISAAIGQLPQPSRMSACPPRLTITWAHRTSASATAPEMTWDHSGVTASRTTAPAPPG